MMNLHPMRTVFVVLAVGIALGVIAAVACMRRGKATSPFSTATAPEQRQIQPPGHSDTDESSGEVLALGRFGCNSPASPPVFFWGPPSREGEGPNLDTPAAAIQTILSLLDDGATDKLASCMLAETDHALSDLYPRSLGPPVGLVEVIEDGDYATVIWEAGVHAEFSAQSKRWAPGDTMMLMSHMKRVEGLWKLVRLHEGGEDGSGYDQSAN